ASPEVRLKRRAAQGERDEIAMRDHDDVSRAVSPLVIAADAYVIDTSRVTIEQVVNEILTGLGQKELWSSDIHITDARARWMNFYYWIGYHLTRRAGRLFFRFSVIHRERLIQSGPV